MTRRRFAFWLGFGLFSLAEKLRVYGLDELAAATMSAAGPIVPHERGSLPVHWRAAANGAWQWYERETFLDGKWQLSGITTPVNTTTGEPAEARDGYLDESQAPAELWLRNEHHKKGIVAVAVAKFGRRRPTEARRGRHGRPPSKWLRSLQADELRIWLKTIDPPEATVSGMTFWEHLTRDHSFDPERIEGLSGPEQAKLHAAAHHGY